MRGLCCLEPPRSKASRINESVRPVTSGIRHSIGDRHSSLADELGSTDKERSDCPPLEKGTKERMRGSDYGGMMMINAAADQGPSSRS